LIEGDEEEEPEEAQNDKEEEVEKDSTRSGRRRRRLSVFLIGFLINYKPCHRDKANTNMNSAGAQ
jgi:hypothetical protein